MEPKIMNDLAISPKQSLKLAAGAAFLAILAMTNPAASSPVPPNSTAPDNGAGSSTPPLSRQASSVPTGQTSGAAFERTNNPVPTESLPNKTNHFKALPGQTTRLGASWIGNGVNFAVYSAHATKMELCLFNNEGLEQQRITMFSAPNGVWHCFLPQARPGQLYGYRAHGPFNPQHGLYFNPHKLLLDPYTQAIGGRLKVCDELYGYHKNGSDDKDLNTPDGRDNAPYMLKSCVTDPHDFDWQGDHPLNKPLENTIIYEIQVKGFSKLNEKIPQHLRGTYAGLAHPASIKYLKDLGITAVELLPVHLTMSEPRLDDQGLSNYWGYNTLGFFCPDPRFSANPAETVNEFKSMVKTLHQNGLEVILDVVYNHTAEQGADGPQLSLRGLDNLSYYRLDPPNTSNYCNFTGCGNSVDTRQSPALQLVTDSLRFWVEEMHIDGFRFDLATTLARVGPNHAYSPDAPFLKALAEDPTFAHTKLIAEAWDCGPDSYQVGKFPQGWSEWNGDWRDTVRRFWKGDTSVLGKLAIKLSGSPDLYSNRSPLASINYVTAHDGFTLNDSVSYEQKHNLMNGEDNRDGSNDNHCWNCGLEGPTEDPAINRLRWRQMRNMLLTTLLSQGVPMLLGGDEQARTQAGNNNAYCQDNAISYYDWLHWNNQKQELFNFTRSIIALRQEHPVFRNSNFAKRYIFYSPDGQALDNSALSQLEGHSLGMYLEGSDVKADATHRESPFLLLFNNGDDTVQFNLPEQEGKVTWQVIVDTYSYPQLPNWKNEDHFYRLQPHSAAVLESSSL